MKFVNAVANKSEAEREVGATGRLRMNHDKTTLPDANPPLHKPDRFAPKSKAKVEPRKVQSPAKSSLRGQLADAPAEPSNAEIMAFLLKNFPNAK